MPNQCSVLHICYIKQQISDSEDDVIMGTIRTCVNITFCLVLTLYKQLNPSARLIRALRCLLVFPRLAAMAIISDVHGRVPLGLVTCGPPEPCFPLSPFLPPVAVYFCRPALLHQLWNILSVFQLQRWGWSVVFPPAVTVQLF